MYCNLNGFVILSSQSCDPFTVPGFRARFVTLFFSAAVKAVLSPKENIYWIAAYQFLDMLAAFIFFFLGLLSFYIHLLIQPVNLLCNRKSFPANVAVSFKINHLPVRGVVTIIFLFIIIIIIKP